MTTALAELVLDAACGRLALPNVPRVVQRVVIMLRDPSAQSRAIAQELEQDPVLAAKVLRLANSPFFAGRRALASISDAIHVVGSQALGTLVIASGIGAAFVRVPGVDMRDFWLHAAITAAAARTVARAAESDPESAYLAGLLHETGHLILCQANPEEAQRRFGRADPSHGSLLERSEREAFGIAHPEVGGYWCDTMQLPEEIGAAIRTYLDADALAKTSLGVVIQVATALAGFVQAEDTASEALSRVEGDLLQLPGLDNMAFERGFDDCYARLQAVTVAD
jgi:HD-like signal output (HDOD) protein